VVRQPKEQNRGNIYEVDVRQAVVVGKADTGSRLVTSAQHEDSHLWKVLIRNMPKHTWLYRCDITVHLIARFVAIGCFGVCLSEHCHYRGLAD
jgi:hypothetical protein